MPSKRSNKTRDIDQIAAEILEEAVGEPAPITPAGRKNPAAMDLEQLLRLERGTARVRVKPTTKANAKAKPNAKRKAKPKAKRLPLKGRKA
jgi:hypothetical protein